MSTDEPDVFAQEIGQQNVLAAMVEGHALLSIRVSVMITELVYLALKCCAREEGKGTLTVPEMEIVYRTPLVTVLLDVSTCDSYVN